MTAPTQVDYPIAVVLPPIYRGDSYSVDMVMQTSADPAVPVDLSLFGDVWASQVRTNRRATTDVPFAVDDSMLSSGVLTLSLTGVQTAALTDSGYVFDVQASGGTRSPWTVWAGNVPVSGDVTRDA